MVSNTAEYGGRILGPKIVDDKTRQAMKECLEGVHDGSFAKQWMKEYEDGLPELSRLRAEEAEHPIEVVGKKVRQLFSRENK